MTDAWCEAKRALGDDWQSGNDLHPREVDIWKRYLAANLTAEDAARELTVELLYEAEQESPSWHPWGLLTDALMELPEQRTKVISLLHAIRALHAEPNTQSPQAASFATEKLNYFRNLWADEYRGHILGPFEAERRANTLSSRQVQDIARESETAGRVEAELYQEGIFPLWWGWGSLAHLVKKDGVALEFFIGGVFEWLNIAAEQLWLELPHAPPDAWSVIKPMSPEVAIVEPIEQHWELWKRRLEEIEIEAGTEYVRTYARKCLDKMRHAESKHPR